MKNNDYVSDLSILLDSFNFKKIPKKKVDHITLDSRLVKKNSLFFAVRGDRFHGKQYINEAINNGASAVLVETNQCNIFGKIDYINNIPIIYINNLKDKISFISGKFYKFPSKKLKLIGVTGTNGKTTIAHLIAQLVNKIGENSAVISTIGNGVLDDIINTDNTTDSAVDIQFYLKSFLIKKVNFVSVEVSSHALIQSRVLSLFFDVCIFSNITNDHLDYHGNMVNYEQAKWLLFSTHKSKNKVINIDDEIGLKWIKKLPKSCVVCMKNKVPLNFNGKWIKIEKVDFFFKKTVIYFNSTWGGGKINTVLIGYYNVINLMLSIASLLVMGYSLELLIEKSKSIKSICGRMEPFIFSESPIVFVDYAHNPDALKKSLIICRSYSLNKVWCVFGCGGNRYFNRRFLMGKIAKYYADFLVITDDNPRNESSEKIINDILSGISDFNSVFVIRNRFNAIKYAIKKANNKDVILISGKGHEKYQIFKNFKIPFSDQKTVLSLLKGN